MRDNPVLRAIIGLYRAIQSGPGATFPYYCYISLKKRLFCKIGDFFNGNKLLWRYTLSNSMVVGHKLVAFGSEKQLTQTETDEYTGL